MSESEIDRLQEEIDGVARNKRWVNWIDRFQKRLQEHKKFTLAQRKNFLEGMLTSIDVELIAPNLHRLIINFELPIVEDSIEQSFQTNYRPWNNAQFCLILNKA